MAGEDLTAKDAARYLGVQVKTLQQWLDGGEIPFTEDGQRYRIRRSDLDAFIETRRVRPGDLRNLATPRKSRQLDGHR